jgi:hypothetical protein
MSAAIESCKLINLQLIESKFDAGIEPESGSSVELQLKYKVDFELPEDSDEREFLLKIDAGLKAVSSGRGENEFFSAESRYLCRYLVEEVGVELDEYSQFSEQLGKRVYLTIRERLMNVLTWGDRGTFLPYDLPPKKDNQDDDNEI